MNNSFITKKKIIQNIVYEYYIYLPWLVTLLTSSHLGITRCKKKIEFKYRVVCSFCNQLPLHEFNKYKDQSLEIHAIKILNITRNILYFTDRVTVSISYSSNMKFHLKYSRLWTSMLSDIKLISFWPIILPSLYIFVL